MVDSAICAQFRLSDAPAVNLIALRDLRHLLDAAGVPVEQEDISFRNSGVSDATTAVDPADVFRNESEDSVGRSSIEGTRSGDSIAGQTSSRPRRESGNSRPEGGQ